ncbi:Type I polyketide synthase (Fragment) OS=Streptomyces tendae OX=1932 GN=GUR47_28365 PE=4 SV=1 [Streptomyces tendae]
MLPLVAERIRLIKSAGGATVGVAASAETVLPLLDERLSLAAANGPAACTVAGHTEDVERLERELTRREVPSAGCVCRPPRTPTSSTRSCPPSRTGCATVTLRAPRIPYVTDVTGTWARGQVTDVRHWLDHTRHTVRFADGISTLWERDRPVLVEIGPGDSLAKLAARGSPTTSRSP